MPSLAMPMLRPRPNHRRLRKNQYGNWFINLLRTFSAGHRLAENKIIGGSVLGHVVVLPDRETCERSANSSAALDRLRRRLGAMDAAGTGRLPPERQLAVELGIGRRALRRALDVLEAEGLIARVQGSGTFVGRTARRRIPLPLAEAQLDPMHVIEARLELEPVLARLAAGRAEPHEIEAMRLANRCLDEAADDDACELWDGAFHRTVADAAGNTLLFALFDRLDHVRQNDYWRELRDRAQSETSRSDVIAAHENIIAAIAAGDAARAEAAMRAHLIEVSDRLRALLAAETVTLRREAAR